MPQIQITVSSGIPKAQQSRAQHEDVSVIGLIRSSLEERTDDGVSEDVRLLIDRSIEANRSALNRLVDGPRTYHNLDER